MNLVSPIQKLGNNGNNSIFIKREDLLPFSFGGNKLRIALEYFEDMDKNGYGTIISYGSLQSNLNRVISNLAKQRKKECYIVSPIIEKNKHSFNRDLCKLFGAKIIETKKQDVSETIELLLNRLEYEGKEPYYIYGNKYGQGRKDIPIQAYKKVFEEIKLQEKELNVSFDRIFVAVGTGSTLSGLMLGAAELESNKDLIGVSIARKHSQSVENVRDFLKSSEINDAKLDKVNWEVTDKFLCGGYGKFDTSISNTITKTMQQFGIPLDSTYTGKAFWGMENYLKNHSVNNENILFIHTGGTPLFFDELEFFE